MATKEKNSTYPQDLIDILNAKPHIKTVYLNDEGEWLFSPAEGFKAVSVTEVLKGKPKEEKQQ